MRILVYGAGVLGCNLARNLFHVGTDVTLHARGDWAGQIQQIFAGTGTRWSMNRTWRTIYSAMRRSCCRQLSRVTRQTET